MTALFEYNINDVRPYINWVYFYHAWGLSGKPASEKAALRSEAETILAGLGDFYHTHAVFGAWQTLSVLCRPEYQTV